MTAIVTTLDLIYTVALFALIAGIAAGYALGWVIARVTR